LGLALTDVMTSRIDLTLDHGLGRAEALARLRARCAEAERRRIITVLSPETRWTARGCVFAVSALGHVFRGRLSVTDQRVKLTADVPLVARCLSARLAAIARQEGLRLLAPDGGADAGTARAAAQRPAVPRPAPRRERERPHCGASDAVIGVVADYRWDELRVWANSLNESGFAGDRVVIATGVEAALVERLRRRGYKVVVPSDGERLRDARGQLPILVERFFFISKFLEASRYRFVVLTDVRDIVFQENPSAWLEANVPDGDIVASSEGLRLRDEWWGRFMLSRAFGDEAYRAARDSESFNAGVIAGRPEQCRRLCLEIVRLSTGRAVRNADQAAYNLVLNSRPWRSKLRPVRHDEPWACQAGTVADPIQLPQFRPRLIDVQPTFDGAAVRTPDGEPYAIVHQYDRVPVWRACFESRFA
jgi:hypothetical protein